MKVTIVPIVIGTFGTITKGLLKGQEDSENGRNNQNDSIAENSQNPETSPGDLRRLAVTQTQVKNHQLTLIGKNTEGVNNNNNNNTHVVPLTRISLVLSSHFSPSFIASGRSSGLHPVSSHSFCMYVHADRTAFARPYVGVHRSTSLMNSSLLLQQCPACLVRLTWIVFVMGSRWPYSWCLLGCCCQDLLNIARNILA